MEQSDWDKHVTDLLGPSSKTENEEMSSQDIWSYLEKCAKFNKVDNKPEKSDMIGKIDGYIEDRR